MEVTSLLAKVGVEDGLSLHSFFGYCQHMIKLNNLQNYGLLFTYIHAYFLFLHWLHCSFHSFLESRIVIIVIKSKEHILRCPYRMRAKARVMSEIKEV